MPKEACESLVEISDFRRLLVGRDPPPRGRDLSHFPHWVVMALAHPQVLATMHPRAAGVGLDWTATRIFLVEQKRVIDQTCQGISILSQAQRVPRMSSTGNLVMSPAHCQPPRHLGKWTPINRE